MTRLLKKWPLSNSVRLCIIAVCGFVGCDAPEQNKTIPGLQEQAKVQAGQVNDLKAQVELLKKERQSIEQANQAKIVEIKKEYEDRQVKIEEINRTKVAQLTSEISDLRLELGAIQREKIALQEMLDRGPRIEVANSTRRGYDVIVFGVLLIVMITMLLYVSYRYRSVHDRLNLLTMQQTSELRRIGARA